MKNLSEDQKKQVTEKINLLKQDLVGNFLPEQQRLIVDGLFQALTKYYDEQALEMGINYEKALADYKAFNNKEYQIPAITN